MPPVRHHHLLPPHCPVQQPTYWTTLLQLLHLHWDHIFLLLLLLLPLLLLL
jgi:hypothetical protein